MILVGRLAAKRFSAFVGVSPCTGSWVTRSVAGAIGMGAWFLLNVGEQLEVCY